MLYIKNCICHDLSFKFQVRLSHFTLHVSFSPLPIHYSSQALYLPGGLLFLLLPPRLAGINGLAAVVFFTSFFDTCW